jgi:hypothetical protein
VALGILTLSVTIRTKNETHRAEREHGALRESSKEIILDFKCGSSIRSSLRCLVKYIALGLVTEASLEDGK